MSRPEFSLLRDQPFSRSHITLAVCPVATLDARSVLHSALLRLQMERVRLELSLLHALQHLPLPARIE